MVTATLEFTDAQNCRNWLARLPLTNVPQCHALLAGQMKALAGANLPAGERLAVLELMRETVASVQAEQGRKCWGGPVPLEAGDRALWESVVGLWQAMAAGYESLISDMAGAAPELAVQSPLICQRALSYTGLAMREYTRTYHGAPGALWQQLHRLYILVENAGVATAGVSDPVGRAAGATSCAATYVHALLTQLAQPDALTVQQMEIIERWLDRWEGLVGLSPDPAPASTIPALAVDLASQKGAGLAKDMPAAGLRHLNLETLGKTLRQTAVALKQQTPAQLGLGDLPREACEKMLLLLHIQWCAAGTGRVDERASASIKVMIAPNLASIHFHLTGKAFRQPGGEMTALERQRLDLFEHVSEHAEQALASQRSAAIETWVIVNQSVSGFLGTCRQTDVVNRVSHGQLVGLQPPAKKVMYLGIVQRLIVDEAGTIWIGLRIIPGVPQAVAARIADGPARGAAAGKYDRALLMPEDAARKAPASIVLMPGWHQANRVLDLQTDKGQKIKLQALLDRGPNFDRATYAAG